MLSGAITRFIPGSCPGGWHSEGVVFVGISAALFGLSGFGTWLAGRI